MKNEEVVIEELEKVKNILKEVNEELKNKKGIFAFNRSLT